MSESKAIAALREMGFKVPTPQMIPSQAKALIMPRELFWGEGAIDLSLDERLTGLHAYAAYWLAYACMTFRAQKLIEAPLWVAEQTDDGEEWVTGDHPVAELLAQPNPDMELADLLETLSLLLDAGGRALLVKNRGRAGRTESLYPFSRDEFEVQPADGRLFGRFIVHTSTGRRTYAPEEVIYFRNVDPRDQLEGLAPLDAALAHVNLGQDMRRAVSAALIRSMRPGSVTSVEGMLDEVQFERLRNQMNSSYAGVLNLGKNMLLEGGAKWQQLKAALDDLALGPVQDDIEVAVCACFQLHPMLVGTKIGLTSSGGFADSLQPALGYFYDLVAIPRWKRIAGALTRGLLREFDEDPNRKLKFDTSEIRALQLDMTARVAEAKQAADIWTVNERRVHTGQAPLDDERGDAISAPQANPFAGLGLEGMAARTQPEIKAAGDDRQRRTTIAIHLALRASHIATMQLFAERALTDDKAGILALLPAEGKAASQKPVTDAEVREAQRRIESYLTGEALERWKSLSEPVILSIARGAVERAGGAAGVSFDLLQPGLLDYVKRETAFLVKHVTETTRDRIASDMAAGLEAGETHAQMRKRIQDSTGFGRERAQLIARTEATRATNSAARETMQSYAAETGLTVRKTWITAGDELVRDEHRALDGETKGIDEPFSNGRQNPDEPNCRCSITMDVSAAKAEAKPTRLERRLARTARAVKANTDRVTELAASVKQLVEKPAPEPVRTEREIVFTKNGRGDTLGARIIDIPLSEAK